MKYRLIYDETQIIGIVEDVGRTRTIHNIFTGTIDECRKMVANSNLADPDEYLAVFKDDKSTQAAYDAASSVFNTLSIGKRALWEPVRQAVGKAILEGNMAEAKEILETLPALYEGAEEDRAKFLVLFK